MIKKGSKEDEEMGNVSTKLYVKYMVSLRCKMKVRSELENLELPYKISPHGALEFYEEVSEDQLGMLKQSLLNSGLVLLNESESKLIDEIINTVIEAIHYSDALPRINFTDLFSKYDLVEQKSILKIFSDVKGMSIIQFIVIQKIEKAKELLLYEDMSIPEIAELLIYKNKHYFLAQFKKVTGLTPDYFMRLKKERNKIAEQPANSARAHASGM